MHNKFNMTVEENIFVAKRNIIDYIWKSARLEGLGVTYPDTEAIYNGMMAPDVKVSDIIAVNNLKHAWQFILDTTDYPMDYPVLCRINQIVGGDNLISRAGYIRNVPVAIGGTTWKPDMPDESSIKEAIQEIMKIENTTQRAIKMMLYSMRTQPFIDGNKRTSMLAANQIMVGGGAGIITVPIEKQPEFTRNLVKFYETNDDTIITDLVYNHCIDGIDFSKQKEIEPEYTFERITIEQFEQLKQQKIFPFESRIREQDGETYAVIKFKTAYRPKLNALIESMKPPRNNRLKR